MFNFLDALQGSTSTADKEEQQQAAGDAQSQGSTAAAGSGLSSLWSVATAVTAAVKQTAGDVVRSVQTTDWKSELAAFTHEVQTEASTVAEVVSHIPEQLQPAAEPPAERGPSAAPGSPTKLTEALGALGTLGASLLQKTQGVFEQVTDLVEHELETAVTEVERMAAGKPVRSNRLAARQQAQAKYSRFDAEVAAMQRDSSTYCDEPADADDFQAWRSTFDLTTAKPEIERIIGGNAFMAELQSRIVPLLVEYEDFWLRYFYKLHKLQQREEQRQQLAARAKLVEQQEEPGWEDDEAPESPSAPAPTSSSQQATGSAAGATAAAAAVAAAGSTLMVEAAGAAADDEAGVGQTPPAGTTDLQAADIAEPAPTELPEGSSSTTRHQHNSNSQSRSSTSTSASAAPDATEAAGQQLAAPSGPAPSSSSQAGGAAQPELAAQRDATAAPGSSPASGPVSAAGVYRGAGLAGAGSDAGASGAAGETGEVGGGAAPATSTAVVDPAAGAPAAAATGGTTPSSSNSSSSRQPESFTSVRPRGSSTETDGSGSQREWCLVAAPQSDKPGVSSPAPAAARSAPVAVSASKNVDTVVASSSGSQVPAAPAVSAADLEEEEEWGCMDDAGNAVPVQAEQGDDWGEWD